ncbi:MAG TPA: PilZ domain-containing protein [Bryobacteraceae bacterium]|nr:PilZ domain-containing protein [Bryobacteraceae bacterium]
MERRQNPRLTCELPLTILRVDGAAAEQHAKTIDVSTNGGVRFRSSTPLSAGQEVDYELTLSLNFVPVKILCTGRVARCEPAKDAVNGEAVEIAITMARYRFVKTPAAGVVDATSLAAPVYKAFAANSRVKNSV